jgi:hypothetical protein
MQPETIPLHPDYKPELLDYHHRSLGISKPLYEQWQNEYNAGKIKEDFNQYTKNDNPHIFQKVTYCLPSELENYRVYFNKGKVEHFVNNKYVPLSSNNTKKATSYIALIIPAKPDNLKLHAINMQINSDATRVHHSSLVAGGNIFFAAEAHINNGVFAWISDSSGHYKPDLRSFCFGLNYIASNIDLSNTKIKLIIKNEQEKFDADEYTSYSNGKLFTDLYVKNGFNHKQYRGSYNTIDLAKDHITNNNIDSGIYFISKENQLYAVKKHNSGYITTQNFTNIFNKKINNSLKTKHNSVDSRTKLLFHPNNPSLSPTKLEKINNNDHNLREHSANSPEQKKYIRTLCFKDL